MTGKLNVLIKGCIPIVAFVVWVNKRINIKHVHSNGPFGLIFFVYCKIYRDEISVLHITDAHPFLVPSFEDPGPHGNGRYSEHMLPEIEMSDFRKGAQV